MATVLERVKKVVVEQLGVEEKDVVATARFVDDLGADSLDLVELVMALEEEFTTPAQKIEMKSRMMMLKKLSPCKTRLIISPTWVLKILNLA